MLPSTPLLPPISRRTLLYVPRSRAGLFLAISLLCTLGIQGFAYADDLAAAPRGAKAAPSVPNPKQHGLNVQWHEWDDSAFERAKAEDKLIVLDLTAVWCHACHVMDETTYSDPEVIERLNSRFVPIRVDTDRRPDIEARYRHGGWPTTSVLLPTGEILFQANFLEAEDLNTVLAESEASYRENKGELLHRAAKVWAAVHAATSQKPAPNGPVDAAILEESVAVMRESFDAKHGGFRVAPKFFEPDAITFAFLRYHRTKHGDLKQMALRTLDGQIRLLDPVWGGFYRYAEEANWSRPHYEKMLDVQALNLENYLEAYQVTHDQKYKAVAERVIEYVDRFLSSPTRQGFYASQDADVRSHASGARSMAGEEYFSLREDQRIEAGLPRVDRAVYTSSNGMMIASYLRAFQVLGRLELRDQALRTLNHLYRERYRAGLGMAHVVTEGEPRGYGLLEDQVFFGQALLEAFLTTGDRWYMKRAESLVADLLQLEDPDRGGFFDRPQPSSELGLLRFPYKPIKENLEASILLSTLFYLTNNRGYQDHAERTLRLVLEVGESLPVALLGTAVDRFLTYPVHVVVVGSKTHKVSSALFNEGLRLYAPWKMVRLLDPAEDSLAIGDVTFPRSETPQAYICTDRFCSKPIMDSTELEETLEMVLATGSGQPPTEDSGWQR